MSLTFKKYWLFWVLLCAPLLCIGQQTNGLIYNLRQNWVQYDKASESFLPVISQASGKAISFQLDGSQYINHYLYINNQKKAYLFFNDVLLLELSPKSHYFKIDSLLKVTEVQKPTLTLYGNNIKSDLLTYIVDNTFSQQEDHSAVSTHIRNKSFTSFFIIFSILLLAALIVIKFNSEDLFAQYSAVSKAFNLSTIDELIYKGRFFVNPGIQMIIWVSFSAGFVLYYIIIKLNIFWFELPLLDTGTILYHSIYLVILAAGFALLFLIRYLLIVSMAIIFNMSSIINVHFANLARLTFYLLLALQAIITLDYFSIIEFNRMVMLAIIFGSLFLIIILIGFRLSFIISHTFVQLFIYLCATEIFLFLFVYKLVLGN